MMVVDDFLPDAQAYRDEVLKHPFHDVWFGGGMFKNIQVHSTNEFQDKISDVVGRKVQQAYSFLRINYGHELPHNPIHNDDDIGGIATILYLNTPDQCRGGTALWKHKPTGLEKMPTPHEFKRFGKSPVREMNRIYADGKDLSKWEFIDMAEMKFNRLIMYPAACFHSRYDPKAENPFKGFGTTVHDARLIWITFFQWAE